MTRLVFFFLVTCVALAAAEPFLLRSPSGFKLRNEARAKAKA